MFDRTSSAALVDRRRRRETEGLSVVAPRVNDMVQETATPHPEPTTAPDAEALAAWIGRPSGVDPAGLSSRAMIDQLTALER